jgi:myo-inositol-hexaphosphate 3-phosphohydrolase
MLALERAFSVGVGNTVKLYEVLSQGALDVTDELDLFWEEEGIPFEIDPPVAKRELLNIADLGITPDNLEGMTFGPALSDGRKSLILVSDNNFSDTQVTQFIAFALSTETIPAALPALETPQALDDADADSALRGDSDDPAIWVHPTQRDKSLVLATLKDGGLVVLDLSGRTRQIIAPDQYGDIRYNNVDLVYDFPLARRRVDIAVVSDRQNDTLAIFRIDPRSRELKEITAPDIPDTIFGVDDGEYTAYGLATYTSPKSGKSYAFVTQAGGNLVAQLELRAHKRKGVSARLVRLIELPVPTGDSEDSQAEAMVVDQELGALYVAMENEVGVLELGAEPDADDTYRVVASVNEDFLEPDIEGLAIYYGPKGAGYLLISSQGDSTYAVLERTGEHAYLGSFVVGDKSHVPACDDDRDAKKGRDDELKLHDDERCAGKPTPNVIDQANESDGIEVVSLPLGKAFPKGLLVVQDGANDPQVVVQDEEELENISTNFKFVPWENVANAFAEPLLISPNDGSGPRGGNCGKKRGRND